ncbi:DUF6228 family protein [Streptomyces sp. NPDC006649]|uniref:DUF6228 family protein n=1 Tax=Streptomyces sp. NPDC006649 TaxID=3156896 RepID=UPI0033A1104E
MRRWGGQPLQPSLLSGPFCGRTEAHAWRSLERDLAISTEHQSGSVHLAQGIHDHSPSEGWNFEKIRLHASDDEVRNLATEFSTLLISAAD